MMDVKLTQFVDSDELSETQNSESYIFGEWTDGICEKLIFCPAGV